MEKRTRLNLKCFKANVCSEAFTRPN